MVISIDRSRYEILNSDRPMTSAQGAVYAALIRLKQDGVDRVDSASLVREFQFKSVLPLNARLEHLVEKGRLRPIND